MALRAVPDHPKFADLKVRLGLPRCFVLGCLEAIWHFTGRFTPQGDIGKYSDEAIEAWVEWSGAPGALIAALIDSHWIDRDPNHRLLVHDWSHHADKAAKNALARNKQEFCVPGVRTPYVQAENIVPECTDEKPESSITYRLPVPEPVPVPVPESKAKATPKAAPSSFALPCWISSHTWEAFELMRKKIRKPLTERARELTIAKLEKWRSEGMDPEFILNEAIEHSWTGVWPVKREGETDGANKSATAKRVDANRAAIAKAAERLGWANTNAASHANGRALPEPGLSGQLGRVSMGLSATGGSSRPAGSNASAGTTSHSTGPVVLPPSR